MQNIKISKTQCVLITLTVVIVLLIGGFIGSYNGLNAQKNSLDSKWSQVENVMQRRADLIPNLVNSVKGAQKQEKEIFNHLADARTRYKNAYSQTDKLKANDEINKQASLALNVIQENYPQLASTDTMKTLMSQIEGSENRISVERKAYIEEVQKYNTRVTSFPSNITSGLFGFHKVDVYKADDSAKQTPKVDF